MMTITPDEVRQGMLDSFKVQEATGERMSRALWGPPGVGKTEVCRALAEELGIHYWKINSKGDPAELGGVPIVRDGETFWAPPEAFRHKRGVATIDDVTAATQLMGVLSYDLAQEGRIGEHVLGLGWVCVITGNRMEDGGIFLSDPGKAAKNRVIQSIVGADLEQWALHSLAAGIPSWFVGAVKFRPDIFNCGSVHGNDDSDTLTDVQCTPRSLSKFGHFCRVIERKKSLMVAGAGLIGPQNTAAILAVKDAVNLPTWEEIRDSPKTAAVPESGQHKWMVAAKCGSDAKTKEDADSVLEYMDRLESRELEAMVISTWIRRSRKEVGLGYERAKRFRDWAVRHQELFA